MPTIGAESASCWTWIRCLATLATGSPSPIAHRPGPPHDLIIRATTRIIDDRCQQCNELRALCVAVFSLIKATLSDSLSSGDELYFHIFLCTVSNKKRNNDRLPTYHTINKTKTIFKSNVLKAPIIQ